MAEFDPSELFRQLYENDLDPSIFNDIDETRFEKAPNFLEWAVGPQFLNTLILPKQVEIGTKLFNEWCPDCSNPGYIDNLFDQSIGNIKSNIVFLEYGVCPKCGITRHELVHTKKTVLRNELVGCCGQRCIPGDSLVFTERGIVSLEDVVEGDQLSHGPVIEKYDSGVLHELRLKTKHNYTLRGSKDSHILAYLDRDSLEIKFKPMKDFIIGDIALLYSPHLWPTQKVKLEPYGYLPQQVDTAVARLIGCYIARSEEYSIENFYSIFFATEPSWSQVLNWFEHIGLNSNKASIPSCILQSPKDVQAEFLKALYSYSGNHVDSLEDILTIKYVSASKTLIKQLRCMLMNFGYITDCSKLEDIYVLSIVSKTLATSKPKLNKLLQEGYYPVDIIEIEEAGECHMMDVSIPDTNAYTADCHFVHNSGKSKLVAMVATYVNHCFLKLPNPLRSFNQTSGEMLLGTFSGLTLDQCHRNLWNPFRAFMDAAPWFQSYNRFLKEEEKKLGIELVHELQNSITYLHKNIHWYSTGSEARKMRGDTRIFAAIDELGWMVADETKPNLLMMNADQVYISLANSLTTMRTKYKQVFKEDNFDIPPIIMANISSPSSAKDKIMRLTKDAKKNPRILAFNAPTWEMNPDFSYASLKEEFSHMDKLAFNRDFGAEPPLAANPFLSEPRIIDKICMGEEWPNIEVVQQNKEDSFGDLYKTASFVLKKGDKVIPRMITFDLGYRKNSLSCCLFSLTPEHRPKLDLAVVLAPEPDKNLRVNVVDFFENFTIPLVENFRIRHAFFDRWQSLDQIERLKQLQVDARMHSLTYREMESVRGMIMSQSVSIPKLDKPMAEYVKEYLDDKPIFNKPMVQLGIQLLTVRDMGHKMIKPLLGDDDMFRSFCLGVVNIANPEYKKSYMDAVELNTGHRVAHLGTLRHRSGNSGYGSGSNTVEGEDGRTIGAVRSRIRR